MKTTGQCPVLDLFRLGSHRLAHRHDPPRRNRLPGRQDSRRCWQRPARAPATLAETIVTNLGLNRPLKKSNRVTAFSSLLSLKADNQTDARNTRAQALRQRVKGPRADIVIPDQSCVGVEYVEYIDDPAYRYRLRDFELP